ncbi:MAG: Hsp20/alpha crystallin family protein [Chloroflexota bacterium]
MSKQLSYRHRLPSLFESFPAFPADITQLLDRFGQHDSDQTGWFAPSTNVAETSTGYEISLDMPGMKSEDFEVELKEGQLWITGERKHDEEEEGKTWHRVERTYGKFRRVVTLGNDVNADGVEANYVNGVLSIVVPKIPETQAKKIAVKS